MSAFENSRLVTVMGSRTVVVILRSSLPRARGAPLFLLPAVSALLLCADIPSACLVFRKETRTMALAAASFSQPPLEKTMPQPSHDGGTEPCPCPGALKPSGRAY